jgi:hydrogenase expression/formation protein HypD
MKYMDEYRDSGAAESYAQKIRKITTKPWTIMEICGGQTHSIVKYGIDELLPKELTLVHGPGCPVCVTPLELIDKALMIAARPDVIFCSFGDMLRVPGSDCDLFAVKARGGNIKILYSPMDCIKLAEQNPDKQVVFFAVGFETTAPAHAMAVYEAKRRGIKNFSVLVSHVLVPPAMEAILSSPDCRVQGFLAAGHVCTIMGTEEYYPVAAKYKVPIVITGFEPLDILQGIAMCVAQLEQGRTEVENQYTRSVREGGNRPAQDLIKKVFNVVDRKWRGIGNIGGSGLALNPEYAEFDAETRFGVESYTADESPVCISGLIMQGLKKPSDCSAFGKTCNPEKPLGAPMVSSEGACAAYFRYRRHDDDLQPVTTEA